MTASTDSREGGEAARLVDLATEATPAEWLALCTAAHWNQNEDDWRAMLALGRGWGLRGGDDTLVASTLVLPYRDAGAAGGGFAWISMVLVLPQWRGRGFAERLLRVALADLAGAGLMPVLDATPAGRPVYAKLGFAEGWTFTRWRRPAASTVSDATVAPVPPVPPVPPLPPLPPVAPVRRLLDTDWPAIARLDTPAFGAERTALLRRLAPRLPAAAWVADDGAALRGFLLGRDGRTALQLGPLVADDETTACALLDAALPAVSAIAAQRGLDVIADLPDGRAGVARWLRRHGFTAERPFTRMVLGAGAPPGDARRIMMPAGPELG